LRIIAFDLSQHAIDIINKHPLCSNQKYEGQITAFVYDATSESEQDIPNVEPGSVDCKLKFDCLIVVITMIFVLSAIPPAKVKIAVSKAIKALKLGGVSKIDT
jgi:hypothetical protein